MNRHLLNTCLFPFELLIKHTSDHVLDLAKLDLDDLSLLPTHVHWAVPSPSQINVNGVIFHELFKLLYMELSIFLVVLLLFY